MAGLAGLHCIWVLLLALLAVPIPAHGEPVVVRSGEHPGFSRLVLDFGVVPAWTSDGSGTAHSFRFGGAPARFDTRSVFQRIGRNRIRALRTDVGELRIELGCACGVEAYELTGGRLVIDVRDSPARGSGGARREARSGFARPQVLNESIAEDGSAEFRPEVFEYPEAVLAVREDVQFETEGRLVLERSDWSARPVSTTPLPVLASPSARRDRPPVLPGVTNGVSRVSESVPSFDLEDAAGAADVSDFQGHLLALDDRTRTSAAVEAITEALRRAAEQGIVEFEAEGRSEDAPPQTVRPERAGRRDVLPLPTDDDRSLRVTTTIDRNLGNLAGRLPGSGEAGCLDGYDLDVGSWGKGIQGAPDLAARRGGLLGEFDAARPKAVAELARGYIYLSFGAEARAVLAAYPIDPDEQAVLEFLADIADGDTRPAEDDVVALLQCRGPVALWAMLALADPPQDSEIAHASIAAAFSALPLHLRRHYGPTLVDRYLSIDDPDAARTIWSAVDRAAGQHGERFVLASADLAQAEGDILEAEAGYETLRSASAESAPVAVQRLLSSRLDRGAEIELGLVDTASVLAFENRGSAIARDLKLAELRGRIALGLWDEVFEELPRARFSGAITDEDEAVLLTELFEGIADRASTNDFLVRGFEANGRLPLVAAADAARRKTAVRMVGLGLSDQAIALLDQLITPGEADRLVRASAENAAGRHEAALSALEGLSGPEAMRVRGETLVGLNRYIEAAAAFSSAGDAMTAAEIAARGGNWDDGPDRLRGAVAALDTNDRELPSTELARNRTLIEAASELRSDVAGLLQTIGQPAGLP